MLKFISCKSENIVKENIESLVILHLLKWIFENQLIIQQQHLLKLLRYSYITYLFQAFFTTQ
jgi:hypothetical protein